LDRPLDEESARMEGEQTCSKQLGINYGIQYEIHLTRDIDLVEK